LIDRDKQYNVYKFEVVNQLIENECYLENIDKYRYVTIEDIDEPVIPVKLENEACDKYGSFSNNSDLEIYLDELFIIIIIIGRAG
jgi:hypothetical protein